MKKSLRIILIFLSVELIRPEKSIEVNNDFVKSSKENDAFLTTDRLIQKYGYPIENHFVTTEDGYVLQLHRIPSYEGKPILLQHGLLDSSATFVITGKEIAPAYYLWEQGYDVWLGNIRGNIYSRNHISLDPDKRPFWDFTFHEMGVYDLPAMIDYILINSKYKKLTYIGHSQGTAIFFIMCSRRPEYNEKVNVMHALAPIAFIDHMTSPILPLTLFFLKTPIAKFMYEVTLPRQFVHSICFTKDKFDNVCLDMMFKSLGRDSGHFEVSKFLTIFGHVPAGTSLKNIQHFVQLTHSKNFCEYDYGVSGNLEKYGQTSPPNYKLSNIKVPIALYYGSFDKLSVQADVRRLEIALGENVAAKFEGQWNHIDFVWATNVREDIYEKILFVNKKLEVGERLVKCVLQFFPYLGIC